jgi:opacity protein-like surface antigen
MRRMRVLSVIGVACLAAVAVQPARAQVQFGPQLNWASNSIGFGVGARVEASLAKAIPSVKGLGVTGSFDFFFPGSGVNYWEINANGTYHFAIQNVPIAPYVGAGLVLAHTSISNCPLSGCSTTNAGLNILGGTNFSPMGKITPFAEIRIELRTGSAVVLTGGVLF